MQDHDRDEEIDETEDEIDLEDLLELDSLTAAEASTIAKDITVAWIQNNKYEDNLSEEEVAAFFKTMYQAARFPTLWDADEDEDESEVEGNGTLSSADKA